MTSEKVYCIPGCIVWPLSLGVKAEKVSSSLTKDGVLVVTAPRGNAAATQSYTHTIENNMNKVH